jgi:carotenoid cleavage dioxygenase-like enzyme
MADGYEVGFRSVNGEVTDCQPSVRGSIPGWLSGTLLRNGPGRFEVGDRRLTHWFDGLAMLRRYAFDEGTLTYSNRFLRTEAYADATAGDLAGQFGTDERGWRKLLAWLRALGPPDATDNANVHVARVDGEYVALTEAPRRVAFEPDTLETRGAFAFDDALEEHVTGAHLVPDPRTGEWFGFATQFGRQPQYHLYRIPPGSHARDLIASVDADGPAYVHDCSITDDHVVLVETPLVMPIRKALSPFTEGILDVFDWQPERGTRVLVVDRDTGELLADPTLPPVFTFHHVNAYTDGGEVVLDLVEFPDASIVDAMRLDDLAETSSGSVPDGRPTRYRIDPGCGGVDRTRLHPVGLELPRVARSRVGVKHRYVYAQATERTGANGLVKLDCESGTTREWWSEGVFVEEPVPVRRPGATARDEGVVLAPALDSEREVTRLLVFDASTLDLRADARLPHVEPFGFHGRFFEGVRGGAGRV